MGCGKSTLLLQDLHNAGRDDSIVFTGSEFPVIESRIAGNVEARTARSRSQFATMLAGRKPKYVFVDEAQFLNEAAAKYVCWYADYNNITVRFYGLLSDFKGNMFPATSVIVPLANEFVQLPGLIPCSCGGHGSINARIVKGKIQREGAQILEADIKPSDVYYQVMCRMCWRKATESNPARPARVCRSPV